MRRSGAVIAGVVVVAVVAQLGAGPAAARVSVPGPGPVPGLSQAAARQLHHLGAPPQYAAVPGHHASPRTGLLVPPARLARRAPLPSWPGGGSVDVPLAAAAPAGGSASWAQAGLLPVKVEPAQAAGAGQAVTGGPVTKVRVHVGWHSAALAAGADGMILSAARADGSASAGQARLQVSYAGFASAYGGGYASRLTLETMPACALTTPKVAACRVMTPLPTVNSAAARTLTALVTLPAAGAPVVLAAAASASGGTGDFRATSLAPSSQWQVGLQTGDFSWSYPFKAPPGPAGGAPSVGLAYASSSTDGETAQDNSQPGQVGEGFSLSGGGFIEQKYAQCSDHLGDSGNNTGQKTSTGDLCWDGANAMLSLAGKSSAIIYDPVKKIWRLAADDGSSVQLLTGAVNGAYNGWYWKVTTTDGTQYVFGLNELPGWATGKPTTNSVWDVPVVGLKAGDPCNKSGSYTGSVCKNMPWRWNLDEVIDPNGNVTSYWYAPQTNYYAFDSTSTGTGTKTAYTSGGTLSEIDYGSQKANVYANRPMKIALGWTDRCDLFNTGNYGSASVKTTCETAANKTGADWPDTPWDLWCSSTAACTGTGHQAPAFFDTQMLTSVSAQLYEGTTLATANTWVLGYAWLAADVNSDLTLASITRTGNDGGNLSLLPVNFGWTPLANRVNYDTNPTMDRYRLTTVTSETGSQVNVGYTAAACPATMPADPSTNTYPCFPQKWTAGDTGNGVTVTSWFYKYLVAGITVSDPTGGNPPMVTSYNYGTSFPQGAAWHYDTDIDMVPPKDKSWSQYRGYQNLTVTSGAAGGTQSETDYTFLRGMDGDPLLGGKFRSVTVTPTRGGAVTDSNAVNGFQLEKIDLNGPGGAQVSDEITLPWTSPATGATASQSWGAPITAVLTGTAESDTYTPLSAHAGGGTREVQVKNTYDPATGMITQVDDHGDVSVPGQALCKVYTYPSPPSAAGLLNYPDEEKTTAGACGTISPPLVSDAQYLYDNLAFGAAPSAGNITTTQTWSAGDPGVADHWVKTLKAYDSYGQVTSATDPGGNVTTTTYTTGTGAGQAITQTTVKNPLNQVTTTDLDPLLGQPADTIDASGQRTDYAYDPLGRVTSIWLPGQTGATRAGDGKASYIFAYSLTATAAPYVTTSKLISSGGSYVTSYEILDSLLRPRQTQQTVYGGTVPDLVSDTFYDSRGNAVTQYAPYPANTSPSGTLWITSPTLTPRETTTVYDGAGRPTEQDLYSYGTLQWKTITGHPGGDAVTVTPPSGGTVTTTYTDGRGKTSEIDQYHSTGGATGAYDATTYTYTPAGQLAGITDPGGNKWAHGFDLLGRQVSVADPDTGTTTSTYNDLGQLTAISDARGKTLSFTYDAGGRKTAEYDTTGGVAQSASNQLAAWTYDTATLDNAALPAGSKAIGQLAITTAHVGGTSGEAYVQSIGTYSVGYQPESTTYSIPANPVTGALAGSYTFGATYNPNGTVATQTYPAAGGLAQETVNQVYNAAEAPYSTWSSQSDYVEQSFYTPDGLPSETDVGTSATATATWDRSLYGYDPATNRLAEARVQQQSTNWGTPSDISYTYDPSGNITTASDTATGDYQCYQYDYLTRLTAAWSQAATGCPATAPSSGAGPAPYLQQFTYDQLGTSQATTSNLTTTLLTTGTGTSISATSNSYTYPAAGTAQPHTAASYTTTSGGNTASTSQTWTPSGQLGSATTGTATTSYTWDAEGKLTAVTGAGTTSYRYDATGGLLVVQDGATSTLYLPNEELTATGTTVTATRYYTHGSQPIAARTPTALTWMVSDHQGTAYITIDPASQGLSRRYFTPFGAPRGTTPATWPGTRSYVGGTADTTTGLTNLGAREYNPATPTFISPDPLTTPYQPQNLNPYSYAAGNPITLSDPAGTCPIPAWCPPHNVAIGIPVSPPRQTGPCYDFPCGYHYNYTWQILPTWVTAHPATAMALFQANPRAVFPFPITGCKSFTQGALCTLHAGPTFASGVGVVRVSVTTTSFTFTVVSKNYFDEPGSQITFALSQHNGYLYLTQHAKGEIASAFGGAGVYGQFARYTWSQQAQNLRTMLAANYIDSHYPQNPDGPRPLYWLGDSGPYAGTGTSQPVT